MTEIDRAATPQEEMSRSTFKRSRVGAPGCARAAAPMATAVVATRCIYSASLTGSREISNVTSVEQVGVTTRYWTRAEYERLVDGGFFRPDEPIELIGGRLIVSEPQGSSHAVAVGLTSEALRAAFGPGWVIREEKPVALDDDSEPEPDLAVVPGTHRDYSTAHPARPVLVVEVAETSLAWDRGEKGSLYARARIGDYWIVNLIARVLEVYRNPVPDPLAPHGWRYGSAETFLPPSATSPQSLPGAHIPVAGLLP